MSQNSSKQHPKTHKQTKDTERKTTNNPIKIIITRTTPYKQYKEETKPEPVNRNKAHKGNTLVILYIDDYKNKIEEFITQNNFTKLPHHITNKQQRNIRSNITNSNIITNKKQQVEIQ
jgi:hypothetical protein